MSIFIMQILKRHLSARSTYVINNIFSAIYERTYKTIFTACFIFRGSEIFHAASAGEMAASANRLAFTVPQLASIGALEVILCTNLCMTLLFDDYSILFYDMTKNWKRRHLTGQYIDAMTRVINDSATRCRNFMNTEFRSKSNAIHALISIMMPISVPNRKL